MGMAETSFDPGVPIVRHGTSGDDRALVARTDGAILFGNGGQDTLMSAGFSSVYLVGDGPASALSDSTFFFPAADLARYHILATGAQAEVAYLAQEVSDPCYHPFNSAAGLLDSVTRLLGTDTPQSQIGQIDDTGFVTLLYQNGLGRAPDAPGLAHWTGRLAEGESRAEVLIAFGDIRSSPEISGRFDTFEFQQQIEARLEHANPASWSDEVFRLYQSAFGRDPDAGGFGTWSGQLAAGLSLEAAAARFLTSAEGAALYAGLDDTGFVQRLYQNVLDRAADTAGLNDWTARLANGTDRATVLIGFSESAEHIANTTEDLTGWMRAQGGDDTLVAQDGSVWMIGGVGADSFVFSNGADDLRHRVYDLEPWDQIDLSAFDYATADEARSHMREALTFKDDVAQIDVIFEDQGTLVTFDHVRLSEIADDMLIL